MPRTKLATVVRYGGVPVEWPMTTASDLDRFRVSANSAAVSGIDARHAFQRRRPPKQSMNLKEATRLVGSTLEAWLAAKM